MINTLGESIRKIRTEKGLSQQQFADMLFVDRSTFANWETGRRMPDAAMISRIAECLGVDVAYLLNFTKSQTEIPNIMMIDDERIILTGGMPVLKRLFPKASINGFTKPSEALEFAKINSISLAFVDIEIGKTSGIDLCQQLLTINPRTNVIFLTAYADYSFEAWDTGASGFILKPLTDEAIKKQLSRLRYPFPGGEV